MKEGEKVADIEKVKQGIKACWSEHWFHKCCDCPYKPDRDNDNKCVERLGADALERLKDQKNLIDVLIEDQLKKDEEQTELLEKKQHDINKMCLENSRLKHRMNDKQPKKGEWDIDEYGIHHCPFCKAINETVYQNFCPNCGADMRKDGGQE